MRKSEEYILSKPEPYKSILIYLQLLIEKQFPNAELKYKWHLPYYYFSKKPFCFLNQSKHYVDVAFRYNNTLEPFKKHLVFENRKLFCSLRYTSMDDVDANILAKVLKLVYKVDVLKNRSNKKAHPD